MQEVREERKIFAFPCFVYGNMSDKDMLVCMEINKGLSYNFNVESVWKVKIMQKKIYIVHFIEVVI